MAILFKKGDVVIVAASAIKGPVLDIKLNADYVLQYLISYTNDSGEEHQRWFKEDELGNA